MFDQLTWSIYISEFIYNLPFCICIYISYTNREIYLQGNTVTMSFTEY